MSIFIHVHSKNNLAVQSVTSFENYIHKQYENFLK